MDTKRPSNIASVPPDIEIAIGWNACVIRWDDRHRSRESKRHVRERLCKHGDAENRLAEIVGQSLRIP